MRILRIKTIDNFYELTVAVSDGELNQSSISKSPYKMFTKMKTVTREEKMEMVMNPNSGVIQFLSFQLQRFKF